MRDEECLFIEDRILRMESGIEAMEKFISSMRIS